MIASAFAALVPVLPLAMAQSYPIAESMAGKTFLDGWNYPDSVFDNTTNGDVFWAGASNTSVIYVNDAGRVILKVDDGFVPYNEKRWAPKLVTKKAYPPGTVWVMDAVHMPYGCSVWPALWTQGPDWPNGGEIDIMEGVHLQKDNQVALHTHGDGCYADNSVTMTGTLGVNNCSVESNAATGCIVNQKSEDNSYGDAFAKAGGGVYVTEFTDEYVKVWFISRPNVPANLTADAKSIDTGSLGTPTAYYPSTTCDISKYFGDQTLTIDITLCGTWGSLANVLEQSCPKLEVNQTCYSTYVMDNATAADGYKTAYFELNYINIFSNGTATAGSAGGLPAGSGDSSSGSNSSDGSTTTTATTPGASGSTGGNGNSTGSGSDKGNSARRVASWWGSGVALLGAAVAFAL